MAHTPGPWKVVSEHDDRLEAIGLVTAADGNMVVLASIGSHRTKEEIAANTRLIAAAPRLLKAAQETLAILDRSSVYDWCELRAAIASATGENLESKGGGM